MFGLFAPRCPLDTWEKAWVEWRMRWLAGKLGPDRMLQAEVILPGDEHFPDPYDGTPEAARLMMDRLCGYLGVGSGSIGFEVWPGDDLPGARGHYDRTAGPATIRVAQSVLADPMQLAATLAHELSHEILLGGGLLSPEATDHQMVIDLLPAFLGVGIFAANATVHEAHHKDGLITWWKIGKHGYLPARMHGYAMALFCYARWTEPDWACHLRPDAASALHGGLRYLRKTGDSLFGPDTLRSAARPPTAGQAAESLRSGTRSARLAALWDVNEHGLTTSACYEGVCQSLADRDSAIAAEAARTLIAFGAQADSAMPALLRLLHRGSEDGRAAAALALGTLKLRPSKAASELCFLLNDPSPTVRTFAARSLGQLGIGIDGESLKRLIGGLESSLITCSGDETEVFGRALLALAANVEEAVRDYFHDRDAELALQAIEALEELRETLE
jgi:hypothetical protein